MVKKIYIMGATYSSAVTLNPAVTDAQYQAFTLVAQPSTTASALIKLFLILYTSFAITWFGPNMLVYLIAPSFTEVGAVIWVVFSLWVRMAAAPVPDLVVAHLGSAVP